MTTCTCLNGQNGNVNCEEGQMAVCVEEFDICRGACLTVTSSIKSAIAQNYDYQRLIGELLDSIYKKRHYPIKEIIDYYNINIIFKRDDGANVNIVIPKTNSRGIDESLHQSVIPRKAYNNS